MAPQNTKNGILALLAIIGTFIAESLGGWDSAMITLVIIMVIDYVTGLSCALVWHKSPKTKSGCADSSVGWKGLIKKGAMFLVVLIAVRLDTTLNLSGAARLATILFFVGNEGISVVENLGIMGVPFPGFVKNSLAKLKADNDDPGKAPGGVDA